MHLRQCFSLVLRAIHIIIISILSLKELTAGERGLSSSIESLTLPLYCEESLPPLVYSSFDSNMPYNLPKTEVCNWYKSEKTNPEIPQEIFCHILSYLPHRTLMRCYQLSKNYHTLITETIIKKYLEQSQHSSKIIFDFLKIKKEKDNPVKVVNFYMELINFINQHRPLNQCPPLNVTLKNLIIDKLVDLNSSKFRPNVFQKVRSLKISQRYERVSFDSRQLATAFAQTNLENVEEVCFENFNTGIVSNEKQHDERFLQLFSRLKKLKFVDNSTFSLENTTIIDSFCCSAVTDSLEEFKFVGVPEKIANAQASLYENSDHLESLKRLRITAFSDIGSTFQENTEIAERVQDNIANLLVRKFEQFDASWFRSFSCIELKVKKFPSPKVKKFPFPKLNNKTSQKVNNKERNRSNLEQDNQFLPLVKTCRRNLFPD